MLVVGGVALALTDRAALGADADDAWIGKLLTGLATLLPAINFVLFAPFLRKSPVRAARTTRGVSNQATGAVTWHPAPST